MFSGDIRRNLDPFEQYDDAALWGALESVSLKPTVEATMRFFGHAFKEGVGLEMEIPEGIELRGDSNQIVQVLINLTQNAMDAMKTKIYPEGDGPKIRVSAEALPDRTVLRFRDNGPGINDDLRHSAGHGAEGVLNHDRVIPRVEGRDARKGQERR